MQYVMETVFVGPQIKERDVDNRMVQRMTRIVAQFAEFGWKIARLGLRKLEVFLTNRNPNNDTDEVLKYIHWPKHDSEQEFYLEMGYHFTEKQGLALDRYAVWDELEKSFSLVLNSSFSLVLLGTVLSIYSSCK